MEDLKNIFMSVVKDNYANFNGRARRREYWMFQLATFIIYIALFIVVAILGAIADFLGTIGGLLLLVAMLGLLVPNIAVLVRRLHDINKSGWFYFVSLIPLVGGFYLLYLLVTEGDKGANQYGEDPKAA